MGSCKLPLKLHWICNHSTYKMEQEKNKKLSYRRDSARRRLLRRSRSFKVTDFSTNRKWIILTHILSCTVSNYRAVLIGLSLLTRGCLSLTHSFSLHFCRRECRSSFNQFDAVCFKVEYLHYLEPFRRGLRVWQTYRQTDRLTDRTAFSNSAV